MRRPLYHRLLNLRQYRPGPVTTFALFEGSVIVPAVLAFADLLAWTADVIVPVVVAAVVKFNDVVVRLPPQRRRQVAARGVAQVPATGARRGAPTGSTRGVVAPR
jgi:hypothetical protein